MKVNRFIEVYIKKREDFIEENFLSEFDLRQMVKLFNVSSEDPLMYNPYQILEKHQGKFPEVIFDFEKYEYYITCRQE